MRVLTSFIALVLLVAVPPNAGAEDKPAKRAPLTLSLSTNMAPAPAQVTARISVTPDARSRGLIVEWWADDGAGGSHEVSLDGANAAARQDFAIKRMDAGTYIVRVVLLREDGSIVKREANLVVVGEGSRFISGGGAGADLVMAPPPTRR